MKLTFDRELEIGDTIVCKGIKVEIAEIITQDFFQGSTYSEPYYDIEFRCPNGKYRRWKSEIDKGYVIFKK